MYRVTKIGVFPNKKNVLWFVSPETLAYTRDSLFPSDIDNLIYKQGYFLMSIENIQNMMQNILRFLNYDNPTINFDCDYEIFKDVSFEGYDFYCLCFIVSINFK